jgi:hypothetical protein
MQKDIRRRFGGEAAWAYKHRPLPAPLRGKIGANPKRLSTQRIRSTGRWTVFSSRIDGRRSLRDDTGVLRNAEKNAFIPS